MSTNQDPPVTVYDYSIRDVAPYPDAIRLTGTTSSGLPSGDHTGGAWEYHGEVYKPLDGRGPDRSDGKHYSTKEDIALAEMAGTPLFPQNWYVKELNGRRFLVRPKSLLIPEDLPYGTLTHADMLLIEEGIRKFNQAHWEVHDEIALAVDPNSVSLFIYDLSNCLRMHGVGAAEASDEGRLYTYFKLAGHLRLASLRQNAKTARLEWAMWAITKLNLLTAMQYKHVYASFDERIPPKMFLPTQSCHQHTEHPSQAENTPYTWVFAKSQIPDMYLEKYGLIWAWSPIHERETL